MFSEKGGFKAPHMSNLIRFGISLDSELLESFDALSSVRGYSNRSEALRDLMRDALVQARVKAEPDRTEVIASLTLVATGRFALLGLIPAADYGITARSASFKPQARTGVVDRFRKHSRRGSDAGNCRRQ